jgi:hypothetical protein
MPGQPGKTHRCCYTTNSVAVIQQFRVTAAPLANVSITTVLVAIDESSVWLFRRSRILTTAVTTDNTAQVTATYFGTPRTLLIRMRLVVGAVRLR